MKLRDAGFLLAFSTALLPLGSVWLMGLDVPVDAAAWFALLFIFGAVPVIDALSGIECANPAGREEHAARDSSRYFRVLTLLIVPLWLALVGLLFFLAQGLVAAVTLEVINYIEHYGLQRELIAPGRYERVSHRHSWNAPQRYTNWLLFNLQRHSDHHAQARRRYQCLLHHADAPQLPAGYATMFVLALLPPLWHRVMDPRAVAQRVSAHSG